MDIEKKISLSNIFGKVSAFASGASAVAIIGSIGSIISIANSPAAVTGDITTPFMLGLGAFALSLGAGTLGIHLAKTKNRLIDEFNRQVELRSGEEIVHKSPPAAEKNFSDSYVSSPARFYSGNSYSHNDGFWSGYWLGSSNSSSHSYSSSSSSRSSSSSKDAAAALAVIALIAAMGAAFYVTYKSLKANYVGTHKMLPRDLYRGGAPEPEQHPVYA